MSITLNLSNKRAKAMLDVYSEEKRVLFSKMDEIKSEIREIDILVNQILKELGNDVVSVSERNTLFEDHWGKELSYNPKLSKAKKAQWAIKKAGRPITVHEITDIIEEVEPHLFIGERDVKRRDYGNQIASPIGTQAREGKVFFREKNEGDTHYKYGLLEWKGIAPKINKRKKKKKASNL